jgi:hypothetical protein
LQVKRRLTFQENIHLRRLGYSSVLFVHIQTIDNDQLSKRRSLYFECS